MPDYSHQVVETSLAKKQLRYFNDIKKQKLHIETANQAAKSVFKPATNLAGAKSNKFQREASDSRVSLKVSQVSAKNFTTSISPPREAAKSSTKSSIDKASYLQQEVIPYHLKSSFKLKSKVSLDVEKPKSKATMKKGGEESHTPYESQVAPLPKLATFLSLDSANLHSQQTNEHSHAEMIDEERYQ